MVPGRTSWLRITIAGARRVHLGYPGAGISDVLIPGVRVTRLLQPAQDPAGRLAASADFSFHQQVPSPFALADPAATAPMARTFTVAAPATLHPQASALARPGPGLGERGSLRVQGRRGGDGERPGHRRGGRRIGQGGR